jgi:hypothetical protein
MKAFDADQRYIGSIDPTGAGTYRAIDTDQETVGSNYAWPLAAFAALLTHAKLKRAGLFAIRAERKAELDLAQWAENIIKKVA